MNIRTRLSLTFFAIVMIVLIMSSIAIYYFAETNRQTDFYRRLKNRALNTARVLTEVKEVSVKLQQRLEQNNPTSLPDQHILIIDSLGTEIYRSAGVSRIEPDSSTLRDISIKREIRYQADNREVLGFAFKTKAGEYLILATAWDQPGHESIDNLKTILLLTFIAGIVIVSLLSWFYSGRVLQPISRIINDVENISEKNLNLRLQEGNENDELSQLAKTFNDMLSRLQSSFLSQKTFIANASHEIKTPITIMSGEIEVALLQERDKNYYSRLLNSVLKGLGRLNALSTQLLLLAESTSQDAKRKFTSFRLDDVLWESKDLILKAFPEYQVEIHFDIGVNLDAFAILGDEHLMRAALLNLMDNGCKYSTDNQVTIIVDTKQQGWLTMCFANSGAIPKNELNQLFLPFYRAAASKAEKGFGIGLSLVNNVVRLHNGHVSVVSENDVVEFTLKLPISTYH